MTVYEIITNKFIESLEQGIIPWRKPWSVSGTAYNHTTKKPYSLINQMLLAGGEYLTFQQVINEGGKVKKGEKGNIVVSYFDFLTKTMKVTKYRNLKEYYHATTTCLKWHNVKA